MKTEEDVQADLVPGHALARPDIPVTINDLAAHDRGVAIVEQRLEILATLRRASLSLLMPNDLVLFRSPDSAVTAFVQDSGCDRIKKLWGIQVYNLGQMERVDDPTTGEFAYQITGDGRCGITGEIVENMEGTRYSTEDYAKQKPEGIQRAVAVKKAARANLDGGITRELAGLKSVPAEELAKAWEGSWKKVEMCAKGRGFGSGDERVGGANEQTGLSGSDIPQCPTCQIPLMWRNGKNGKEGFYGCKNYASHPDTKVIIGLSKAKEMAAAKRSAAPREPGSEG